MTGKAREGLPVSIRLAKEDYSEDYSMELQGKVGLITGSTSSGMGRSTALKLAAMGADIVLNYGTNPRRSDETSVREFISPEYKVPMVASESDARLAAQKVQEAIHAMARRAIVAKADTKQEDQVEKMVQKAEKEFGKIDILVNNACGGWDIRDYTQIDFEHWKNVLGTEIDGVFLTMKHIVPGMRERRWGRIIHIGLAGVLQAENVPAPDYCLGKAARAWMTTAFGAPEFDKGITVNCIEPGPTEHLTLDDALAVARGDDSGWRKRKKPCAHDVAEIVGFLCSEGGRFISGSTIRLR